MKNKYFLESLCKLFAWSLIGIIFLFIIAAVLVPQGKKHGNIAKSQNNLKQIGLALKMYAADNNDQYPPGLYPEVVYRQLIPAYMPNNICFILPGQNAVLTNTIMIGQCGYTFISGSSEKSDGKTPLATERVQNRFTLSNTNQPLKEVFNGIGVNVLCVDGSVYFHPNRGGILNSLFTDAQIQEGKLLPRNPIPPEAKMR